MSAAALVAIAAIAAAGWLSRSVAVGPVQFDRPVALLLIPVLVWGTWALGRRSLAGLGPSTRWTALVVRWLVIVLLVGAVAEPSVRRRAEDVSVVVVLDSSRSIPTVEQDRVEEYVGRAGENGRRAGDRLGTVTVAREAYVQALPSRLNQGVERQSIGATDGTNLSEGLMLALASAEKSAATRVVLISDGNETAGSVLRAAEAARAAGVPVDVLAVEYRYDSEVIVDELITPALVRQGETISVRVVLTATRATAGRLLLSESGRAIDLDPQGAGTGVRVQLAAGTNVFTVPVPAQGSRAQDFEAVFEPEEVAGATLGEAIGGDRIAENNRARAVTFVSSEGRVLVVASTGEESAAFERMLGESRIGAEVISPGRFPGTLSELAGYDAVVLLNQPSYSFTENQQELLRRYVHDAGGGLVMVGGPESFGAGGWIGSPLADALPIRLDPPQKRQMPRGALALVVHSIEIPEGVFWGKEVCRAAVANLSRQDLVGIIEFSGFGGTDWTLPLQAVGDRSAAERAINQLTFGDMPTFDPSLQLALDGLSAAEAGQKHCIVISDGDPSLSRGLLDDFRRAGITMSTVGVNPHSPGDLATMRVMAQRTGGEFYEVKNNALATLPEIFIKEAQTIRRSLIWEGDAFSPAVVNVAAEPMRGIVAVPAITGYVVAAEREGLSLVTLRGKENDPIAAIWQHGLGKAVAFTSDATSRWATAWVSWGSYKQFWEQHVRWAMRPGGSAQLRVTTENRGDRTLVSIDAFDAAGERLNFATFQGRVSAPGGEGRDVTIRQVGPGRYEGVVDSADAGAYVLSLLYRARDGGGQELRGSAQAAISRPFADEFRALSSNRAVLAQVAGLTGGRVLTGDAGVDRLWEREGLSMPVTLTPFWLVLALSGIGLFVADVGVRRVRVDPRAIGRWVRRGATREGARGGSAAVETLRGVRERGGAGSAARAEAAGAGAGVSAGADGVRGAEVAGRKFEAGVTDREVKDVAAEILGRGEGTAGPVIQKEKKAEEGDSLSALKRAKRRAQEEMGEG